MASPFAELESSEKYQSLPPEKKPEIKKKYYIDFILPKMRERGWDEEKILAAESTLFGGTIGAVPPPKRERPYDPNVGTGEYVLDKSKEGLAGLGGLPMAIIELLCGAA